MGFSGERLRIARKYKKLTLNELIIGLNEKYNMKIHNGTISRWENGKVIPRIEAIQLIAEYLDVPVDYLLGKCDFGNLLLHLRLKEGLSIEKLSELSGITSNSIYLAELGVKLLDDEEQLNKIGKVFSIDNFRSYISNLGVDTPYTLHEANIIKEYEKELEEDREFEDEMAYYDSLFDPTDLNIILGFNEVVKFKQRILTQKEREKIIKVIDILLDNQ